MKLAWQILFVVAFFIAGALANRAWADYTVIASSVAWDGYRIHKIGNQIIMVFCASAMRTASDGGTEVAFDNKCTEPILLPNGALRTAAINLGDAALVRWRNIHDLN